MSTTPTRSTTPARRRAALAVAGLTMASLGASVVQADVASAASKARVNATIKLTNNRSDLSGRVSSPRRTCTRKVQVVLYWLEPGKNKFVTVEKDKTTSRGAWKIDAPGSVIPSGKYYVKLAPSAKCQAERSTTIRVS